LAGEGSDEPDFVQFDDGQGTALPPPAADGMRNEPIRALLERRLNDIPAYRELFAGQYPEVAAGRPIRFAMVAQALAESSSRSPLPTRRSTVSPAGKRTR
jgi:hypothetical protein